MFTDYMYCLEFIQEYKTGFKKANVSAGILADIARNCEITVTHTRAAGNKVLEHYSEIVPASFYANVISSVPFFKDRVTKTYTPAGYIGTIFKARNPYSNETITREFSFKYLED